MMFPPPPPSQSPLMRGYGGPPYGDPFSQHPPLEMASAQSVNSSQMSQDPYGHPNHNNQGYQPHPPQHQHQHHGNHQLPRHHQSVTSYNNNYPHSMHQTQSHPQYIQNMPYKQQRPYIDNFGNKKPQRHKTFNAPSSKPSINSAMSNSLHSGKNKRSSHKTMNRL